jgi:glycosyltransferase involved in cell wall biosynthesis
MKKNVLQLIGSFHTGGSERQAVQLTKLLSRDRTHNVFLASLNNEGILRDEVEKIGFTEIPEFKLTSFYDLNFALQLKNCVRFFKQNKIQVVHTHDFYTNIFGISAAMLAGVPLKIASKCETGGMRSKMQKTIENKIFNAADAVVVNSEAVKKYLSDEGISSEKIEIIYNGIDLERFALPDADRRKICEELNLPTGENIKFITLVANLRHEVKNQSMLLRVAQKLKENFPDAHFVLAGEGELKNDLEKQAKELKIAENTHFIGSCTQIPKLLSISFAGVLTSLYEGFSNSILEYMAAKLPVVATNVGGAGEAIVEEKTGFLIESDDYQAMASRLSGLLRNPESAKNMGELGRQIVEENFSCAVQLGKTLKLYESVIE